MIPLFDALFDDAAVFPPGDLPLPQAVPAHQAHRSAWYAELVGPFLCGANKLGELAELAQPGMPVTLVLPGGPDQLAPALAATAGLTVVGVELAAGAKAGVAALDQLPAGVTGAVELARGESLFAELDVLAGTPYRAKFRTGGLAAEAFPSEAELAAFVRGCAERGIAYKCTAGLHNAVRHTDSRTGFEHHGFLNVLLAAADPARAEEALAERSGQALAAAALELTAGQIAVARASFTAFGTCSIAEPLDDLAALGLLPHQENP
ncbi:hypothetical protein ABT095_07325 [Kitasatospora sp. NPDC002227]|uniref:hypothetical protein n=1 Tax=Kitasatospora sp. NPDC002227 TaxID=3154773 RepID=UPI00331ACEB3